jgi:hypothetical protein
MGLEMLIKGLGLPPGSTIQDVIAAMKLPEGATLEDALAAVLSALDGAGGAPAPAPAPVPANAPAQPAPVPANAQPAPVPANAAPAPDAEAIAASVVAIIDRRNAMSAIPDLTPVERSILSRATPGEIAAFAAQRRGTQQIRANDVQPPFARVERTQTDESVHAVARATGLSVDYVKGAK